MIFESQLACSSTVRSQFQPQTRPQLQRKCACGGTPATGECEECKAKKKRLQRRSSTEHDSGNFAPGARALVNRALQAPAHPLDFATRAFLEPRFGHDFGAVRIHRGADADAAAQAVNAAAFTVGRDIVIASPFYEPETATGRQLLAHELVHTIQQSPTREAGVGPFEIDGVNDPAEMEADRIATDLTETGTAATDGLSRTAPHLARTDCRKVPKRTCKGCIYKCGWGNSGCCAGDPCTCKGAAKPPFARVLAVLAIIGLSISLVYLIAAAVADPEPVTKLALIGLSAAQIALLLSMLGFDISGPKETSAEGGEQSGENKPAAVTPSKVA